MDTEGQKEPKGVGVDGDRGGALGMLRRAPGGNWASYRPSQGTGRHRELLGFPGGMRRGPPHSLCSFRVSRSSAGRGGLPLGPLAETITHMSVGGALDGWWGRVWPWHPQEGVWVWWGGFGAVGEGGHCQESQRKDQPEPGHERGWLHFKLVF